MVQMGPLQVACFIPAFQVFHLPGAALGHPVGKMAEFSEALARHAYDATQFEARLPSALAYEFPYFRRGLHFSDYLAPPAISPESSKPRCTYMYLIRQQLWMLVA